MAYAPDTWPGTNVMATNDIDRDGFLMMIGKALLIVPALLLTKLGLINEVVVAKLASTFVMSAFQEIRRVLGDKDGQFEPPTH